MAGLALLSNILVIDPNQASTFLYDVRKFDARKLPPGGLEGNLTPAEEKALKGFSDSNHYKLYRAVLTQAIEAELDSRAIKDEHGKAIGYHRATSVNAERELEALREKAIIDTLARLVPKFKPSPRYAQEY